MDDSYKHDVESKMPGIEHTHCMTLFPWRLKAGKVNRLEDILWPCLKSRPCPGEDDGSNRSQALLHNVLWMLLTCGLLFVKMHWVLHSWFVPFFVHIDTSLKGLLNKKVFLKSLSNRTVTNLQKPENWYHLLSRLSPLSCDSVYHPGLWVF